jgi:transposase
MVLKHAQLKAIAPHCLGKVSDPGQTGGEARVFLEAVLCIARPGSPWRDLPADFGHSNSVFKRFRRWVKRGAFAGIFSALSEDSDFEYVLVDGTIVRVHRHGQGAKGEPKIRRSARVEVV